MVPSQLHTCLQFNYTDNDIRIRTDGRPPDIQTHNDGDDTLLCADVNRKHILCIYYRTVSCWLWTNRKYVLVYDTLVSRLHGCRFWLNTNTYIVYMERYRLGFRRTGSTLVLVHLWIWVCHYLVYKASWHHHNYTLPCYSTSMTMAFGSVLTHTRLLFKHTTTAMTHDSALMLIEFIYCAFIVKRYRVDFGRVACTLVCIGVCLHFDMSNDSALMTLLQLRDHMIFKYIAIMTYGSALMLMLLEYMEWCRIYFRTYVGIGARLNLNVSLFGVWYMALWLYMLMLIECMGHNDKWLRADVDSNMEWHHVGFGRSVGTLVCIGACLHLNVS